MRAPCGSLDAHGRDRFLEPSRRSRSSSSRAARRAHLEVDAGDFGTRVTTEIVLRGGGEEGVGEEVGGPGAGAARGAARARPGPAARGALTLALLLRPRGRARRLARAARVGARAGASAATPSSPPRSTSRCARPACRCTRRSGARRGRCASSTRSGSARSRTSRRCSTASPPTRELRFKLDAHPAWTPEIIAALVETRAVDVIDFKGCYGLEVTDEPALLRLYERLLAGLPRRARRGPAPARAGHGDARRPRRTASRTTR